MVLVLHSPGRDQTKIDMQCRLRKRLELDIPPCMTKTGDEREQSKGGCQMRWVEVIELGRDLLMAGG